MRVTPHRHIPRRFVELVPNKRVVEIDEFETKDPVIQELLPIIQQLGSPLLAGTKVSNGAGS
jgi:hypothetical protein